MPGRFEHDIHAAKCIQKPPAIFNISPRFLFLIFVHIKIILPDFKNYHCPLRPPAAGLPAIDKACPDAYNGIMKFPEGPPGNHNTKTGPDKTPATTSRRDFLKKAGIFVAATAIDTKNLLASTPADPLKDTEALLPSETPTEIFTEREMIDMVMNDDFERSFIAVAGEGNRVIQLSRGSRYKVVTEAENFNRVFRLYKGNRQIYFIHTHPLRPTLGALNYSPERVAAVLAGSEAIPYGLPPSIGDLRNAIGLNKFNAKNKDRCWSPRLYTIDGVYEYGGGASSPLFIELEKWEEEVKDTLFGYIGALDAKSQNLLNQIGITRDLPLDTILQILTNTGLTKKREYKPVFKQLQKLAKKYEVPLEKEDRIKNLVRQVTQPASHEEALREYQKLLNSEGFTLTFLPYENFTK